MFFTIGGKKIWYEIYGAEHSDALLYLHGGPGASCLDFEKQAKALGQKIEVVVFDQLGVLRSDAGSKGLFSKKGDDDRQLFADAPKDSSSDAVDQRKV